MDPIVKRLMENHKILNEMAEKWSTIEKELKSRATKQVILHLLKLYYWGVASPNDINGWKQEVYDKFNSVHRLSSNNKYPTSEKIYKAIDDAWGDTYDAMEKQLNGDPDYKSLPRISIDAHAISYCDDYIRWMSKELSVDGAISREGVYAEIDKLLAKYKRI